MNIIETNTRYGYLTVIKEVERHKRPSGQSVRSMLCKCDCGNERVVQLPMLLRLRATHCGCKVERHGDTDTKLHNIWRAMISRCKPNAIDSHRYYYRGISVRQDWLRYKIFKNWAIKNGFKEGLQIDRINNSLGYYPDNCRFVSIIENANNRDVTLTINYKGIPTSLSLLLHNKGIHNHYGAIYRRIKRGWDETKAVDTPIREGNYQNRWQ